jgi:hypothetical protein
LSNKQGFLEKLLILKLEQGICKISLEHPVAPEDKEVLKTATK